MTLPNCSKAYIPPGKLSHYLLSETHPIGRSKARFLRSAGFSDETAHELEAELLAIACNGQVVLEVESSHGVKYVVDGSLPAPNGTQLQLRTVWIIDRGRTRPRLVTAYPGAPAIQEQNHGQ